MEDLLDLTTEEYRLERKVAKLRDRIKARTIELNIQPEHTPDGHFYRYNNNLYGSVTAKLQILKDYSLTNWKVNKVCEYIFQHFPHMTEDNIMEHLEKAKQLPQTEFETAGNIGKIVHGMRERWFQMCIKNGFTKIGKFTPEPENDPPVISCMRAINQFVQEKNYVPLACELYVADDKLQIGGTVDDIGLMDGKLVFIDLKTSNVGDKDSYFYQVALYTAMFEKLYRMKTQAHYILHVSKNNGTYNLIEIPDIRARIKESKLIVRLDNILRAWRETKKKQPIVI